MKIYIYPGNTKEKLKNAQKDKQNVYICAMTGFGKTALIEHFLGSKFYFFFDCLKSTHDDYEKMFEEIDKQKKNNIVVIDNLQFVKDDLMREDIKKVLLRKDCWTVILSRAEYPNWLLGISLKTDGFVEILEQDLVLEQKQFGDYLLEMGVFNGEEDVEAIYSDCRGQGMALNIVAETLKKESEKAGEVVGYNKDILKVLQTKMWDYIDGEIFTKWDEEVLDFFVKLSIVDSFDRELANAITGSDRVDAMIMRGREYGNFLKYIDDEYHMDITMRRCCRRKIFNYYDDKTRSKIYYNAGMYYKGRGRVQEALNMFEKCNEHKQIFEILVEHARLHPGISNIYELRQYYLSMPDEDISASIELMSGISMLYSIMLNIEKSDYWYNRLKEYEEKAVGKDKKKAKSYLTYLDIGVPHRGVKGLVDIVLKAGTLFTSKEISVIDFSATSNSPSNMNGGKDFSEWSKKDKELAKKLGKILSVAVGKQGKGIADIGVAESQFEKGASDAEVIKYISKAKIQIENNGAIEELFVVQGLMSKIQILNGNLDEAVKIIKTFKEKVVEKKADHLLDNIDGYLCELSLLTGDSADYMEWFEKKSPDEIQEFYTIARYRYLTKARIYLSLRKWPQCLHLIEQLIYYSKNYDRTYLLIQSYILRAILKYRMGETGWKEDIKRAYEIAEEYHFVRVLSHEGKAVLPLYEKCDIDPIDKEFYNDVLSETRKLAAWYPNYMKESVNPEVFSDRAIEMLRYLAQGLSNDEIADKMCIKATTVKYHCRETYQKLGVNTRMAAVEEARKRKLI